LTLRPDPNLKPTGIAIVCPIRAWHLGHRRKNWKATTAPANPSTPRSGNQGAPRFFTKVAVNAIVSQLLLRWRRPNEHGALCNRESSRRSRGQTTSFLAHSPLRRPLFAPRGPRPLRAHSSRRDSAVAGRFLSTVFASRPGSLRAADYDAFHSNPDGGDLFLQEYMMTSGADIDRCSHCQQVAVVTLRGRLHSGAPWSLCDPCQKHGRLPSRSRRAALLIDIWQRAALRFCAPAGHA
jgi:hypothetical protein